MALHTEIELKKMTKQALGALAEDFGFDTDESYTKTSAIEYILENQVEDDDELDDDELDDEVDDTDDEDIEPDDDELDDEVDDDEIPEPEDDDELDDEEPEPAPKKKTPAKKAKKVDTHDGEETLAAKQVAALLNTDAKTLRQFFRSPASTTEAVGSGGRYEFLESQVDQIRNEFATWMENKKTRTRTKSEGGTTRRRKERVIPEEEIADEVIDLEDELDELEDDFDDELDD